MNTNETSRQIPEDENADLSKQPDPSQDESTRNETKKEKSTETTVTKKDKPIGNPATPRPIPPFE